MGNNSVPKFIFRLSRFPVYRGSVLGRFYCSYIDVQTLSVVDSYIDVKTLSAVDSYINIQCQSVSYLFIFLRYFLLLCNSKAANQFLDF